MYDEPRFVAPAQFDDPQAAFDHVRSIYETGTAHLRDRLHRFVDGEAFERRIRAYYPFVRIHTDTVARADSRLSYGFVAGPGTYQTTLTRPDLFDDYYREQFGLLLANHGVPLEIGTSIQPIPVHFALGEHDVVTIVDVPDIETVTALCLAASGSGLVRTKTTALLTVAEADKALAKKPKYRGPGK